MTPLESDLLHKLGLAYLGHLVRLSIFVFFYGAPSLGVFGGSYTSSRTGVSVVLFSASVVLFAFVFPFLKPLVSQQDLTPET